MKNFTFTLILLIFPVYLIVAQATRNYLPPPVKIITTTEESSKTISAYPVSEYEQDFEGYLDFSVNFDPWTTNDQDGSDTYGIENYSFPNNYSPMAFIVFNPDQVDPPMSNDQALQPHTGVRFAAAFSATTPPSNDWLISPKVLLGDGSKLKMWVKSYTDEYGLEKYKVGVSTTDNNPASFDFITGVLEAPANEWTQVEFDLGNYDGQEIYFAINCVSYDAFIFMLDDIELETDLSNFPSPENLNTTLNEDSGLVVLEWDFEIPGQRKSLITKHESAIEFLWFKIYRDNILIDTSTTSGYLDTLPEFGQYEYYITAKYVVGESLPSNYKIVSWGVGLDEPENMSFSIYPNPVKDLLYVDSHLKITNIRVINLIGQTILDKEIDFKSGQINLSDIPDGIYIIQIDTAKGKSLGKIIKSMR